MTLDEFIAKTCARPLPLNPMARVRTLAKELAEGAVEGLWDTYIYTFRRTVNDENVSLYLEKRWNENHPSLDLLEMNEYATWPADLFTLKKAAFDLLEEAEAASIFISYKRSESSAFAMYVLTALKHAGLAAFVDMTLLPGENWRQELEQRIRTSDYFILLLSNETLASQVTLQELAWAIQYERKIIPIWHNRFSYQPERWGLPAPLNDTLSNVHTVRVLDESALGYHNAMVELLNRFGITP